MPLVTMKEVLQEAQAGKYAVGAFNPYNLESAQTIISAAEKEKSPVILQIWSGFDAFIGIDVLASLCLALAAKATVPVVVHLDHGGTLDQIGKAVKYGLSSVMIDGSALPFADNVSLAKQVIDFVRGSEIDVEGEIGHVGNAEMSLTVDDDIVLSSIDEVVKFYEETNVNSLAVSIGSAHGKYDEEPKLDIELLKQISAAISVPLVLHGGSYIPDEQIQDAIANGISKINISTELGDCFIAAMEKASFSDANFANEVTAPAYEAMGELVQAKMQLFKSSGKAGK